MRSKIEPCQFESQSGLCALSRLSPRSATTVGGCSRSLPGQSFIRSHVRPYRAQRPPGRIKRPVRVQMIRFLCCSSTIAATRVDDERTPLALTSVRVFTVRPRSRSAAARFEAALVELAELRKVWPYIQGDASADVVDATSWVFPGLGHKRHRVPAMCTQVGRVTAPPETENPWNLAESGVSVSWCPGTESNRRHGDFQSPALPTELPGQRGAIKRIWLCSVKRENEKNLSADGRLRIFGRRRAFSGPPSRQALGGT